MLYRLKYGAHHDGKRFYQEGETVESSLDLISLFPAKFEEVSKRRPEVKDLPPSPQEGIKLKDLTIGELRLLADEERISVDEIESREQLLEVIKAVLG